VCVCVSVLAMFDIVNLSIYIFAHHIIDEKVLQRFSAAFCCCILMCADSNAFVCAFHIALVNGA